MPAIEVWVQTTERVRGVTRINNKRANLADSIPEEEVEAYIDKNIAAAKAKGLDMRKVTFLIWRKEKPYLSTVSHTLKED